MGRGGDITWIMGATIYGAWSTSQGLTVHRLIILKTTLKGVCFCVKFSEEETGAKKEVTCPRSHSHRTVESG